MELALNLVWVGLALLLVELCLHFSPSKLKSKRGQYVALLLVIVILLPIISVSDDILAAQVPAEIDTVSCARSYHDWVFKSAAHPAIVAALVSNLIWLSPQAKLRAVLLGTDTESINTPALSSIDNRPPPAA
jgi:hypothetical protein